MRKIFFILLLLPAFCQAQIYIANQAGAYVAYGLSTDTKPTNPPANSLFIETNTGNIYLGGGGIWTLPTKQKTIKALSDFPTPVSNVITLPDSVSYLIKGTVDIGVNRFVCGVKNSFIGQDRVNDKLISTTTGVMFTMDGTTTSKSNILFSNLTIGAASGTLLNVTSPTANQAVGMIDCTITTTGTLGTINNVSTWAMTNIVVRNSATTAGFTITGANGTVKCRLGVFGNNVGTTFNFGTATQAVIDFNNNQIDCSAGQTFMSGTTGGANVTVAGKINNNTYTGAGTFVSTIAVSDPLWNFTGNLGTTNTLISAAQLSGVQPTLVSATNIKTVNGSTLLGSGDLVVGGSVAWGGITGTLSNQTDLNAALASKQASGSYATTAQNALKVNYTDTASMLAAYQTGLNGKQASGSYATTSQNALKVNYTDTSSMLSAYQTSINGKQASLGFTPYNATNPNGYINAVPAQTFASLTGKPTTLNGYGITDAYPLSGNPSGFLTAVPAQTFASLTGKPTTLSGYGITDAPTGSGTSTGTNTGDNAVNTLYSGLAASKVNVTDTSTMLTAYRTAINGKQAIGSYLVASDITGKVNYTDTSGMLTVYRTSLNGKQPTGSYLIASDIVNKVNYSDTSTMLSAYRTAINGKQVAGSYLVAADIANKVNYSDTSTMLSAYRASLNSKQATGSYQTQLNGTGFVKATGTTISYDNSTYLTSYTETDPVVKAISGIVKSNGTTISAAVAGTDYQVVGNYASGVTNTGDNATNTQYSGLAASKADLASPALTGTPTAPTATAGTNTTQIATTAFVNTAIGQSASTNLQSISAGTGYTLTATSARAVFGTTSPQITLSVAGTYLINYNVFTDYSAATLAASRAISYKVRRTTNTATDLDAMPAINTPIITLLTFSAPMVNNSFIYTATAGDVLEVWGSISVIPTAGTVKTNYVSINATKLY